jgi:peptide/nickel transport system permease protein
MHAPRSRIPIAIVLLLTLHLLVLVADPLAPYPADEQHRDVSYAPPTRLHLADARGQWHLVPFVYPLRAVPGRLDTYREDTARPSPVRFLTRGTPYRVAGFIGADRRLFGVDPPGHVFLLGTDRYGRDIFSRLLLGARLSLFAGLMATALALGIGVVVGGLSGFYGGWPDEGLMGLANVFLALPWIYLLLAVRSLLPLDLPPTRAFLVIVALIGAVGWARPARVIRSVALSERNRDYVLAARSCGASDLRILIRHVLPRTGAIVLTQAAIMAPRYVLGEITLSFLGLGLSEPTPSWGTLAAAAVPPGLVMSHWWVAAPLAALVPVCALYERAASGLAGASAPERERRHRLGHARRRLDAEAA